MKKTFFLIILLILPALAHSKISTSASQAIVIDVSSEKILYEKNSDQKISPASMTKIMTSIVAFDLIKKKELSINEKFLVSNKAWRMSKSGYSSMFILPNDKISVLNLLKGIIIVSGNDACIVLAEGIAGTEVAFADLMNEKAIEIGLKNTNFTNSSGIYDGNNFSTVSDIAMMSIYMIKNYPELYKLYAEKQFTWDRTGGEPIKQGNRNVLLYRNVGADGIKTGHLSDSGYSLAATTKLNDRRIISVISGTKSSSERTKESLKLINYAKIRYDLLKIPKDIDIKIKSWNINAGHVIGKLRDDLFITTEKRKKNKIKILAKVKEPIKSKVKKGDVLGKLEIYYNNELIKSKEIVSNTDAKKVNFMKRFLNSISFFVWG